MKFSACHYNMWMGDIKGEMVHPDDRRDTFWYTWLSDVRYDDFLCRPPLKKADKVMYLVYKGPVSGFGYGNLLRFILTRW